MAQRISYDELQQRMIDKFFHDNGPCCAGCDWWRWFSVYAGECTKSAPVSSNERLAMLDITWITLPPESGHVLTLRHHVCGDFKDTYDWPKPK